MTDKEFEVEDLAKKLKQEPSVIESWLESEVPDEFFEATKKALI